MFSDGNHCLGLLYFAVLWFLKLFNGVSDVLMFQGVVSLWHFIRWPHWQEWNAVLLPVRDTLCALLCTSVTKWLALVDTNVLDDIHYSFLSHPKQSYCSTILTLWVSTSNFSNIQFSENLIFRTFCKVNVTYFCVVLWNRVDAYRLPMNS